MPFEVLQIQIPFVAFQYNKKGLGNTAISVRGSHHHICLENIWLQCKRAYTDIGNKIKPPDTYFYRHIYI